MGRCSSGIPGAKGTSVTAMHDGHVKPGGALPAAKGPTPRHAACTESPHSVQRQCTAGGALRILPSTQMQRTLGSGHMFVGTAATDDEGLASPMLPVVLLMLPTLSPLPPPPALPSTCCTALRTNGMSCCHAFTMRVIKSALRPDILNFAR